jgi:hypothetical protein
MLRDAGNIKKFISSAYMGKEEKIVKKSKIALAINR